MKTKHKNYLIGAAILLVALLLIFFTPKSQQKDNNPELTQPRDATTSGRDREGSQPTKESWYPSHFFDEEPAITFATIIKGSGYDAAAHFKHDTKHGVYESYGFRHGDKIYEDPNKIELRLAEDGSFQFMKANEGKFPSWRDGKAAKREFQVNGIGTVVYGNSFTKKYPEACYLYALYHAYASNMPHDPDSPREEIEIYPCTFTYDENWQYEEIKGTYQTHEGFFIISSTGIDYRVDYDDITRVPVLGKVMTRWELIGLKIDENPSSENQRFSDKTCAVGVTVWEAKKEH